MYKNDVGTTASVDEFLGGKFAYVVTVCNLAKDICPFFPGGQITFIKFFMIQLNLRELMRRYYQNIKKLEMR